MDDLPRFLVGRLPYWSAAPVDNAASPNIHHDPITFMSVVQWSHADILTMTWHPELESLGEGDSGEIRQAVIDLQTNFAFKRLKRRNDLASSYRAVMSEILVLQSPSIRSHPNVAKLIGVCWETDAGSGDIWPVLISEKADCGDLREFMGTESGRMMSIQARVQLCIDVARGILELHDASRPTQVLAIIIPSI